MAIFLYSLSFTLLLKMNLFLLKEKKKRKKYICKNHTSSPCAKIMCLAARTSFWGQMAFFFSCKTSKKKKYTTTTTTKITYFPSIWHWIIGPCQLLPLRGPLSWKPVMLRDQEVLGNLVATASLLCIGTETHKTRVGRITVMGMRGRVGWRTDRSERL